ncbi:MAG: HAMP domain-containing sensor histidine kinase [Anaerolineae bacterium]
MKLDMIRKSIRWQLPLSYAAIALLSAVVLGTALLFVLRGYYSQREYDYLQGNANAIESVIMKMIESDMPIAAIQTHLETYAFLAQVRVRYLSMSGEVLADSGIPATRNTLTISARPEVIQAQPTAQPSVEGSYAFDPDEVTNYASSYNPGAISSTYSPELANDYGPFYEPPGLVNYPMFSADVGIPIEIPPGQGTGQEYYTPVITLNFIRVASGNNEVTAQRAATLNQDHSDSGFFSVLPATSTLYGFDLSEEPTGDNQRSDQLYTETVVDSVGNSIGFLELSNGPAYSGKILRRVASGWIVASSLALGLAAVVGWTISRRISVPLLALTAATKSMANGDLSTRARIHRYDELGVLATSFNLMAQQVEETVSALRHFVADAAHELHTPLTALRTNLELATDEPRDAARQNYIARAEAQILRLEALMDGLLSLSRIEAGDATNAPQKELSLTQLLQDISELYASRSEQAGLNFNLSLPEEPILVQGNATQLRCAVGNLLDNAIKFTPCGETIELSLRGHKHYVEVEVRDHGIGIPQDELPLIFSRFHRGRNAVVYPGSGLGLAIVKGIIDRHGGQVCVYNMPPGASFLIRLPLP